MVSSVSEEIKIILNGESQVQKAGCSLTELVKQLGLENSRYAIEVNEEIIPRGEHTSTFLNAGDKVEVVQAIGGG